MLRFGRGTAQGLRAIARLKNLKNGSELAVVVIWCLTARERKAVRQLHRQMLSNLEREARAEATEIARTVSHNMMLSGKATSPKSRRLLIEQLTDETLEEKLLSNKEHKNESR